jgi:hypothetical protein
VSISEQQKVCITKAKHRHFGKTGRVIICNPDGVTFDVQIGTAVIIEGLRIGDFMPVPEKFSGITKPMQEVLQKLLKGNCLLTEFPDRGAVARCINHALADSLGVLGLTVVRITPKGTTAAQALYQPSPDSLKE